MPLSHSLWVGSLRGDVDQADLYDAFSRYGVVQSLKIKRAPVGTDCYAVLNYSSPAAAGAALVDLQGRPHPALTTRVLKLREWAEDSSKSPAGRYWRQEEHQQPQQQHGAAAWADVGDEQLGQYGGGGAWAAPGAAAELRYDDDFADELEDDGDDPLVELWVGNLCSRANRVCIRRAFECFGEVANVQLQPAPGSGSGGLQFAFVQLPASAAETALEELEGFTVRELTGESMRLKVRQSKRSLKPLLTWQQRKEQQQAAAAAAAAGSGPGGGSSSSSGASVPAAAVAPAYADVDEGAALEVVCEDGSTALLHGNVRQIQKLFVCDSPPSASLWVGYVGPAVTAGTMRSVFCRYGGVVRAQLFPAPGYNNTFQFGLVQMSSAWEAECARDALQGADALEIRGNRPLKLGYAWPRRLVHPAGISSASWNAAADAAEEEAETEAAALAKARAARYNAAASNNSVLPAGQKQQEQQEQQQASAAAAPPQAGRQYGPTQAGSGGSSWGAGALPVPPCCAACGAAAAAAAAGAALKRCSGCRCVQYCCRDCQLRHWEGEHQRECSPLAQLQRLLDPSQQQEQQQGAKQQQQQQQVPAEVVRLVLAALRQPAAGRQAQLVRAALQQAEQLAAKAPSAASGGVAAASV